MLPVTSVMGDKTVCVGGVSLGRKERFKVLLSFPKLPLPTQPVFTPRTLNYVPR